MNSNFLFWIQTSLAGLTIASAVSCQSFSWLQVSSGGPSPRYQTSICFDTSRSCAILFGGRDAATIPTFSGETWKWSGATWTPVSFTGPVARSGHAMAYDSIRSKVVLFGGTAALTGTLGTQQLNDTWEWDGSSWSLASTSGPSPRTYSAMTFVASRGATILFGGAQGGSSTTNRYNDTWEWNGTSWTLASPLLSPSARSSSAMAHDELRNRTVLFGGTDGPNHFGDTWEYDGLSWTQVSTTGPSPRATNQMAYASTLGKSVLFGGRNLTISAYYGDTWTWDGTAWSQVSINGPASRLSGGLLYDSARGRVLTFGGLTASTLWNDTWSFGPDTASVQSVGTGCAGSYGTPTLAAATNSVPRIGSNLQMTLTQIPPVATVCVPFFGFNNVAFGSTPLPASLAAYGMPGCTILSDVYATYFVIGLSGTASWSLGIPLVSNLAGTHIYLQSLVFDALVGNPAGIVITNGLDAGIGY